MVKNNTVPFFKTLELTCTHLKKFGVYVNACFDTIEAEGGSKALEGLEFIKSEYGVDFFTSVMINADLALFDNREEAETFYHIFENEPFENKGVYACIICPELGTMTENT